MHLQSTSLLKGRVDSLSMVRDSVADDKGNMLAQLEMDEDADAAMGNSDDDGDDDARKTFALGRDPDAMLNRVTKQFDLARSRRLQNAGPWFCMSASRMDGRQISASGGSGREVPALARLG